MNTPTIIKTFASDNYAGVHSDIMHALHEANHGHASAYGQDEWTRKAQNIFKQHFGQETDTYFVFNGTAANVLSLSAMTRPFNAIICAETAHINVDECGSPEKFAQCKLFTVPPINGKITIESIKQHLDRVGDQHQVQPRVISITQATEFGTVYTPQEVCDIAHFARNHNMFFTHGWRSN